MTNDVCARASEPCTHSIKPDRDCGAKRVRGGGGWKSIKGVGGGANKMNDNAVMD